VLLDLDVVINADPAQPPFSEQCGSFGKPLRCDRSSSSRRARRVTPSRRIGRSSLSWCSKFGDRGVDFGQAVEAAMAQTAQQPTLDNQHRRFDLRLT
jgi:hypothetical protein